MRAEFEKIFGAMPHSCTWTGRGYCPTEFGAWDAQHFDPKFTGFVAAWQAARRAQVMPQGWELVPQKATDEMLQAAQKAWLADPLRSTTTLWVAMLAAAPQPPEAACNLSMQPELATEAEAEHEALRSVYEAARGLLRYEGVDDGRAITYRSKLASAIEEVKHIDSGLWEPPEAAHVQMPEPISKVLEDCRSRAIDYATCPSPYNHECMETAFQRLEHQVRQLLAAHAHGITQAKQGATNA